MKTFMLTTSLALAALAGCNDRQTAAVPAQTPPGATAPVAAPAASADSRAMQATATGTVESIDAAAGRIVISHGPVPALDWPAMTMGFRATPDQAASVQVGQQVEFAFTTDAGTSTLTRIAPMR
jgi:Cu(I)/Ag(I) efflux system protein CusF